MHKYHQMYETTGGGIRPVRCGFYGIYAQSIDDASMYVVCDQEHQTVLMIPLTPNFYWTAARLLSNPGFQRVFIAMPTMSCLMLSDLVNLLLKFFPLKHELAFIYPEPIYGHFDMSNPITPTLMNLCKCTDTFRLLGLDCSIHYEPLADGSVSGGYALELITNHGRHMFLDQVSRANAGKLLQNIIGVDSRRPYTWFSMPWRIGAYGGISMFDIVNGENYIDSETYVIFDQFTKQFKNRLVPFRFICSEELNEARGNINVNVPSRLVI